MSTGGRGPESVPAPAPAVSPPPIADLDPEPTFLLSETTQHQADPALVLDLEPEPTKVVAASDQAAAQGLVFAKTTPLEAPVPVLGEHQEMEWVGMQLHACLVCVCPFKTYMTVTGVSMQVEVPVLPHVPKEQRDLAYWEARFQNAVVSPVPKEQRDLAYWEARFQKSDKLFSAGSAMEAIATHEMSLLEQAAGPSTAAEGQ